MNTPEERHDQLVMVVKTKLDLAIHDAIVELPDATPSRVVDICEDLANQARTLLVVSDEVTLDALQDRRSP
jgi:hypothetical protein